MWSLSSTPGLEVDLSCRTLIMLNIMMELPPVQPLARGDQVPNYHNDKSFMSMPFGCGNDKTFFSLVCEKRSAIDWKMPGNELEHVEASY